MRCRSIAARFSTFGIEPERRTADDELGVPVGKLALQFLDDLDRRVVRVGHAEEQLETRVIEPEEAPQVLLEPFVDPLERLEDGHRRGMIGQATCDAA